MRRLFEVSWGSIVRLQGLKFHPEDFGYFESSAAGTLRKISPLFGLYQLDANGVSNQSGGRLDAELTHDLVFMRFGGPR